MVAKVTESEVTFFANGADSAQTQTLAQFSAHFTNEALLVQIEPTKLRSQTEDKPFGFRWFVPELLKHKAVWRDVLVASLVLQLLALGLPLFTQAIIDKVVVHRSQSTLIALAFGMGIFVVFSALLTWVRQYLVLHTGNRVDAVLGATVFAHLFKLPLRYFEHRPTGVISARLHGVETIRDFVASAAISLVLDIPFLLICVAVMFFYSVQLTLLVLVVLALIAGLSLSVAPLFEARLNEQFLLGARNQAFVTEYVAGLETVKSLQLEPQIQARYSDYLASYLESGFKTRQIANTYNVTANTLEQIMTLLVLIFGAWIVMNPPLTKLGQTESAVFTIGMLVAFQMFAGKLSQPVLRIVGLWQQFQQARLAVLRLGDVMNVPTEPYGLVPGRASASARGRIELSKVAFRYAEDLPFLYEGLDLVIEPGKTVAITGASGTGKSTLAKLLLGFYWPSSGQIRIDEIDTRHLAANELRAIFGVVPQETILFSGTVYDNLAIANPHATFEQVMQAAQMAEIHGTIEKLPKGYQTEIGERGAGLSGGQKQRLAIARALLKRPKVLIFDEATSALDAGTAESFAATINSLRGKVTMIFITHALPAALVVDQSFEIGKNS
jgi:ATP-binding cassette, subfamily B, bacterial HlyB/CyaB